MKKKKRYLIIGFLLLVTIIAISYLCLVSHYAKEASTVILDFGKGENIPDKYARLLPEQYQEEYNIKTIMKERAKDLLKDEKLDTIISDEILNSIIDIITDDLFEEASYEIKSVRPSFTSCVVTINTSNVDYESLMSKLTETIKKDIGDPDSALWKSAGNIFGNIMNYLFGDKESSDLLSQAILSEFENYYKDVKKDCQRVECSGRIVYAFYNGKWTIRSMDQEILSGFYGIPLEKYDFDINDLIKMLNESR